MALGYLWDGLIEETQFAQCGEMYHINALWKKLQTKHNISCVCTMYAVVYNDYNKLATASSKPGKHVITLSQNILVKGINMNNMMQLIVLTDIYATCYN